MVLVLSLSTLCSSIFFNHLNGEERADSFTLIVFLVSCDC